MANPITVFNTDILTTISSVEYNGASGVNVDNENRIISLDESAYSAVSSVDNKLDISSFSSVSGDFATNDQLTALEDRVHTNEENIDYISGQIPSLDGYLTKSSADTLYQPIGNYASASDLSYVSGKIDSVSSELSGAIDNKLDTSSYQEYTAGNNIDITDYEISGKDWTTDISNASSYAYNQATAQIPSEFDPTYMSGQIDNKLDKGDFNTYSGVVKNQITALRDDLDTVSTNTGYLYNDLTSTSAGLSGHIDYVSGAVDYVSGSLTSKQDKLTEEQLSAISSISSLDGKFYPLNENPSGYLVQSDLNDYATTSQTDYLSATITSNSSDFSAAIDYLSGHAGKTYEGVLPISVDNTNNEISISSTPFSVQEPLYFVENSNTSVVVGFSGDTFTGASVNIPLTGDGTTANPLGLMNYISWGGNGTTSTFTRSGVRVLDENNNSAYYLASGLNLNNESITDSAISSWNDARTTIETNSASWGGITSVDTNHGISGDGTTSSPIGIASSFQLENPSVYTTATYKGDSIGIEGMMPRIQLKENNSAYNTLGEGGMTITHSASGVGGGYTTSHYGSTMRLNYNDGDYYLHTMDTTKSGLGVAYNGDSNTKAYYNYSGVALTNDNGATNEYVNVASIRNWNDARTTVETNSANWGGGGTSLTGDAQGAVDEVYANSGKWITSSYKGYIKTTGFTQGIKYGQNALYFSANNTGNPGITLYGNQGSAFYKENQLQLTRDGKKISFNIGAAGSTITADAAKTTGDGGIYLWNKNNSAYYNQNGIQLRNSASTASTAFVGYTQVTSWNDCYNTVQTNSGSWTGGGSVGDYLTAANTSSISSFKFANNLQVSPYEVYKGATISGYGLGDNEEAGNFVLNGRVLGLSSRGHYGWGDNNVGVVFTPWHISGDNYVLSSDGLTFRWYDSTIQDMNTWKAVTANTAGVASANDFVTQNGVSLSSLALLGISAIEVVNSLPASATNGVMYCIVES